MAAASSSITVADVVGGERAIGIFSGLLRDVDSLSVSLSDPKTSMTLLAPSNAAMSELPRKPWENAAEYRALGADAYQGGDGQARVRGNMRRFVESHIVPHSPLEAGAKVHTLAGTTIWVEREAGGKTLIHPDRVEVSQVADVVENGQVWVLNGVLNTVDDEQS